MYVYIHVFFRGTSVNFIVGFWFRSQKKKGVRMKRMAAAEWGEILQSLSSTHTGGKRRGFKVMVIAPPHPSSLPLKRYFLHIHSMPNF